ncbi:helix-turn-helix domain-containing protein [Streptomyces olivochromogenes]|uniref:helix-turn-helix domain-containing protein n=1 Tax=Streptomyces olivochromogenes TaxID=1963 RepID=UPI001F2D6CA6|nr:helix-turn-helix transcriptional regulator [Streptomyces olivochromogenes]MCF3132438.1 helix-turn-helix domain-containing protein [Streptomyces olivochromogenes]
MPMSPSSSAQAAREAVAQRLKELRADAGITGPELASHCGWSHPKTYRIEGARTPPSPDDIRRWCEACGAAGQADDIIAQSRTAESMYTEWRRKARTGLKQLQQSYVPLFKATKLFRVYSPTMVPGLLQTEGYARGLMSTITQFRGIPNDVADAVAARLERSRIIHEPGYRFSMVIEEPVLHYQLGDQDAMAAQLGYLLTAGALPQVSLGIIPSATTARPMWPQELFHMYDETLVSVELLAARVQITQPSEIALYIKAFDKLRDLAVYGAEARALIVRALDAIR